MNLLGKNKVLLKVMTYLVKSSERLNSETILQLIPLIGGEPIETKVASWWCLHWDDLTNQ